MKKTSVRNILLWNLWSLFLLSTVIFITYNYLGNWHDFLFTSFLGFQRDVTGVLLFPLLGTFFFYRYRNLEDQIHQLIIANDKSETRHQLLTFRGQGNKEQIILSISDFLYGKAQDNYVALYFLEGEKIRKVLLRSTLCRLVESIGHRSIVRCHRSYMVNLTRVRAIKHTDRHMNLSLDTSHYQIPISKSYQQTILSELSD